MQCGLTFEREQGYVAGAIYVSFIATVALCIAGSLALERWIDPSSTTQIALWTMLGGVFPLALFRYSRSSWPSLEYLLDPGSR